MDFKNRLLQLAFVLVSAFNLMACTTDQPGETEEYLIGSKLQAMSSLRAHNGAERHSVALFDPKLKKIHQFDLANMKKTRTLRVQHPKEEHYVLFDETGMYIIDLTTQGLTIFDKNSNAQHDPIRLVGKPKSAAFNPDLGYLIVYDDLMSVGIVKLSADGVVLDAYAFGPAVGAATIVAGDLSPTGVLMLSLSNGDIAEVNIDNSLAQRQWVYTSADTEFSRMSWVAGVPGQAHRAFVKSDTTLALINTSDGSTISKISTANRFKKLSRSGYTHAVTNSGSTLTLYYPEGNTIKSRQMFNQSANIMDSQLDIASDMWMVMDGNIETQFDLYDGNINVIKKNRTIKKFRISSMLASAAISVPNKAQVLLAPNYYFALYPSDLGYAFRFDMQTETKAEIERFNVPEYDR